AGQPREALEIGAFQQRRILDIEARRKPVLDNDLPELRLNLGDLQHYDDAVVLLKLVERNLPPVRGIGLALDLKAAFRGWLGLKAFAGHEHRSGDRFMALILNDQPIPGELLLAQHGLEFLRGRVGEDRTDIDDWDGAA